MGPCAGESRGPGQSDVCDANKAVATAEDNETITARFGFAPATYAIRLEHSLYRASSGPSASLSTAAAACTTGITRS